jgi:hypothetical protein
MKKRKYIVNGKMYEIPDDVQADFIKDNPNAKAVYDVGGKTYHIPHQEADSFEKDMMPDEPQQKNIIANGLIEEQDKQKINPLVQHAFDVSTKGKQYQQLVKQKNAEIKQKVETYAASRKKELQPQATSDSEAKKLRQQLYSEIDQIYQQEVAKANDELKPVYQDFSSTLNSPLEDKNYREGFKNSKPLLGDEAPMYVPQKFWDVAVKNPINSLYSTLTDQVPGGLASATAGRMTTDFDSWLVAQKNTFNANDYWSEEQANKVFEERKKKVVKDYIDEVGEQKYLEEKKTFEDERISDKEMLLDYSKKQRGEQEKKNPQLSWQDAKIKGKIPEYLAKNMGQVAGFQLLLLAL